LNVHPIVCPCGVIWLFLQGGDPLLLEALDRVSLKPLSESLPNDLGSLQPEWLADALDPGKRLLIDSYLYIFHT